MIFFRKIIFFVPLYLLLMSLTLAQFPNVKVKETYDDVFLATYNNPNFAPVALLEEFENTDIHTMSYLNMGSRWSGVLESLLRMYETTGDRAYIYKFILPMLKVQGAVRGGSFTDGLVNLDDHQNQNSYSNQMYYNGRILWPMAHFVYLVKSTSLYNEPVMDFGTANSYYQFLSYYHNFGANPTFGDISDYFEMLSKATLDNYSKWIDDNWGYKGDLDECPAQLNMEAPWGCALIYMYLANQGVRDDYGVKAVQMARMYLEKNDIPYHPHPGGCTLIEEPYCFEDHFLTCWDYRSVLYYNSSNASYYWFTDGWKGTESLKIKTLTDNKAEDVGHAIWSINFPLLYNKFHGSINPHITGNNYFDDYQMSRFRNAFTKNIWSQPQQGFDSLVDGNGPIRTFSSDPVGANESMGWMALHKWDNNDDSPNTVYEILMNYFQSNIQPPNSTINTVNNLKDFFDAGRFMGLSDIVSAQWEKECFNLTLKNRDVVYNQDFFAKNTLTVDPGAPNDFIPTPANNNLPYAQNSFADPVITEDNFIIEPGITVNMSAGNGVHLKPGFHAKYGSTFHAYNVEECGTGKMARQAGGGYKKGDHEKESENNQLAFENSNTKTKNNEMVSNNPTLKIAILPNPTKGIISVMSSENFYSIEIQNLLGEQIFKSSNLQTNQSTINLSSHPRGIYFVKIDTGEEVSVQKIIYQ